MSENIQYIINDQHERVAVIIAIAEFESMLAEMGLTLDDYERERSRPLRTILDQLRTAGKLDI
ncbi:MAG: hypothetical protein ACXWID_11515 [Pyrinomonadaceae bacterium]